MANTQTTTKPQSYRIYEWDFDSNGNGDAVSWNGGNATFGLDKAATFDGGTIQFEWSHDGTVFINLGVAISAVLSAQHLVVAPGKIRPVLSGSTSPTIKAVLV